MISNFLHKDKKIVRLEASKVENFVLLQHSKLLSPINLKCLLTMQVPSQKLLVHTPTSMLYPFEGAFVNNNNNNNIAFFPKQVEGAFVKATKKTCNVKIKLLLEQGGGMFSWLVS